MLTQSPPGDYNGTICLPYKIDRSPMEIISNIILLIKKKWFTNYYIIIKGQ